MNRDEALFYEVLEHNTPAAAAAYLDDACAGDKELRQRVERLLAAHGGHDILLDEPANIALATCDVLAAVSERAGDRIGPYKLIQQIGEGGMGVVYMAQQTEPVKRLVALKIIKPGMDSRQVIARFEAERQALALMDHPNIAKVLDAGTTESGRPYFVMELVKGIPITTYCDEKRLTPKQRLELFVPVCYAVQHAHQKGIIHRDLKPSNVMIALYDGLPVPKVIDFGVAKATGGQLTDKTLVTGFGSLVGTLEYMSPEQAELNQLDVDTRSDIYSLGVLLYELLTGSTPLDRQRLRTAAFGEMLRIIREEEPETVSARIAKTRSRVGSAHQASHSGGHSPPYISPAPSPQPRTPRLSELDWIVMKALEKDRSRRYETASSLAADIQRYLSDEPVLACPPTIMYRFQKFARKHKPALATAAAIAACLLLGTTVSAWQAVRATANGAQAQASAQKAEEKAQEATTQRDEVQKQRDEVKALNEQLLRTLYASNMNLAHHAWDAGGFGRARDLIAQYIPKPGETDLRGFEWHFLSRLCRLDLPTIKTPGSTVAFSPDGKRIASSSLVYPHDTVKLWDAHTGQELLSLERAGTNMVFSPDGKRLATGATGMVNVWDSQTGKPLLSLKGGGYSVAYSPDGRRLASDSSADGVKVWDAQSGQELLGFKAQVIDSFPSFRLAFSPDSKRLANADGKRVKIRDAQTGQELFSFEGHTEQIYVVAFSADGKRVVSSSTKGSSFNKDCAVKVWDAQTGQEVFSLKGEFGLCVAFSPGGQRLVTGTNDGPVKMWDAQTGEELYSLRGHNSDITSLTFNSDGSRLASTSFDGTLKIWDAHDDQKPLTLKGAETGSVESVSFSPDGKQLVSGGGVGTGLGTSELKVWDSRTGRELFALKGHSATVTTVAYSPDGKRLATGAKDRTVMVWDTQTGRDLLTFKGHRGEVNCVAFSPDGNHIVSGSGHFDYTTNEWVSEELKVWNAQTGQELLKLDGHHAPVWSVAFSPDGKRLASAETDSKTVFIWDAQTGKILQTLKFAGERLAFSPDGKRLATGGGWGVPDVHVWNIETGQELFTFADIAPVDSLAFNSQGNRLATTGSAGLKIWDAETGVELFARKGHCRPIAFSPDGQRLVVRSTAGAMTIYDATPLPNP